MWLEDSMDLDEVFLPLFKRVNKHTNMKGVRTPSDIRKKMDRTINAYGTALKTGYIDSEKAKRKFIFAKKNLKKLKETEFSEKAIARANRHPDGIEALTFEHGYDKAKQILLKRKRNLRRKRKRRF